MRWLDSSAIALASMLCACSTVQVDRETSPGDPPGDPPSDPPGDPQESAFCRSTAFASAPGEAIAVLQTNDGVTLLFRDGTLRDLNLPVKAPADAAGSSMTVLSGGGLIVVTTSWFFDDFFDGASDVAWLTRSGELVDEMSEPQHLGAVSMGSDGTTVLIRFVEGGPSSYLVRFPDGSTSEFQDFDPTVPPLDSGWLAGSTSKSPGGPALFEPKTQELRLMGPIPEGQYATAFGAGFAYLSEVAGVPAFVEQGPRTVVSTPLAALAGRELASLGLRAVVEGGWGLVADAAYGSMFRFSTTGEVLAASATSPAGLAPIVDSCALTTPAPASDGGVMASLRDASTGRLEVYRPEAGTWTPIGRPVAKPGTFEVTERAGTFFIHAGNADDSFCPIDGWVGDPPDDAVPVHKLQIVRPASGTEILLDGADPWSVVTTRDGTCVAHPGDEGWEILDVGSGDNFVLDGELGAFLWLE